MGIINTKFIIITTGVTAFTLNAMEMNFTAGTELLYSDNVNLSENKDDGFVNTLSFGASLKELNLLFNYELFRTLHFNHDAEDRTFQELAFSYNKSLHNNKINFSTNAAINNVSTRFDDFVGDDLVANKTVETRTLNGTLGYQNSLGRFFTLAADLNGNLVSNEDNIGNFHQLGGGVNLQSVGSRVTSLTDYNYSQTFYHGTDNDPSQHSLQQRLGYDITDRLNASAAFYYDAVDQPGAVGDTSQFSWGPVLRYRLKDQSYLELGYQFADDDDDDFWNGAVVLHPTERTQFSFDFTRRFYGDAYDFSLSHKLNRLTNSIRYSERVTPFNRAFFVEGSTVNALQVEKGWFYESALALNKTSFSWSLNSTTREPLVFDEIRQVKALNASVTARHQLSTKIALSSGVDFRKNSTDYRTTANEDDFYRNYSVALTHVLSKRFESKVAYHYVNTSAYSENRGTFSLSVNL